MVPSRLVKEAYCSIEKRCKLEEHSTYRARKQSCTYIIILSHLLRIGDESEPDAVLSRCAPRYTYGVPVPVHTITTKVLSSVL